jgi:hypothetical protein
VPYHSDAEIAVGVETARTVLRATGALAHERGARSVIVVPQFIPESTGERLVRIRVLDDARIPYLLVPIPDAWRIPGDRHPDARANRLMAEAIGGYLTKENAAQN